MSIFSRFVRISYRTLPMVLLSLLPVFAAVAFALGAPPASGIDRSTVARNISALPLSFEQNTGQADAQVRYLSRGMGAAILFKKSEADLLLAHRSPGRPLASAFWVRG